MKTEDDKDYSTECSSDDPSSSCTAAMQQLQIQEAEADPSSPFSSSLQSPAHRFELFGWKPDPSLTEDELYLDIVFLITRSKQDDGRQGHMGALIVRQDIGGSDCVPCVPPRRRVNDENNTQHHHNDKTDNAARTEETNDDDEEFDEGRFFRNILGAGTNTPLFDNNECTSDIHAEINALGDACRSSRSTENCTAYITIPPCKRCFAALVTFGVRRIVTRQASPPIIRETSAKRGIEVKHLTKDEKRRQMERINKLVNPDRTDRELMEIAESVKRKRRERKMSKQQQQLSNKATASTTA